MQHDPCFLERLQGGEPEARASTRLDARDLALLLALDPSAVSADREGRHRAQLLRNVSSELALAIAVGPDGAGDARWVEDFPRTAHFHSAVADDTPLPLAFARHAEERADATRACTAFRALVALEVALVRERRRARPPALAPHGAGSVALSPLASVLAVDGGAHALAAGVRECIDRGEPGAAAARGFAAAATEPLLVTARPAARPGGLLDLHVEPLTGLVAEFLLEAREPLDAAGQVAFGERHAIDRADLAAVVDDLVAEGVLLRG